MKNIILIVITGIILFGCSAERFVMLSEGEYLEQLTKITNETTPCSYSDGGDDGKHLVYSVWNEEVESYNIYMKDDVFSQGQLPKTMGKGNFNVIPNLCKANEKIVFQYFDKTNFDIYYMEAFKGQALTRLTDTDENEFNPSWSPDGKIVVYEKGTPPKSLIEETSDTYDCTEYSEENVKDNQIWLKNIETNELRLLGNGSFPKISPDGKKVLYISYDTDIDGYEEIGTIWIMEINGALPLQITNRDMGYASRPQWSPDGKKIVFELTSENKEDTDIYTISAAGGDMVQHTKNISEDFAPHWSNDGYIYFSSDRAADPHHYNIWRFKVK